MARISVVVPIYNEETCLRELYRRLTEVDESIDDDIECLFVDDGSSDRSREIIRELAETDERVRYIFLSRNFGAEAALTAGIDHADGDAVVLIDADLQDPPEVIPEMIGLWRKGNDIVYAQRRSRKGERFSKRFSAWLFYRIIRHLSGVNIPVDTGYFRLMDRRVVLEVRRCREIHRFVRGLVAWTGFRQTALRYDRDERHAGETKFTPIKMTVLAMDAVLGFSGLPLRISVVLGLLACLFSVFIFAGLLIARIWQGAPMSGYALLASAVFLLGGVQLLMLGVLGEYIDRIYRQEQGRPIYIAAEKSSALPEGPEGAASVGGTTR